MADGLRRRRVRHPVRPGGVPRAGPPGTLGAYVGRSALKDGRGTMVDWRYVDGAAALPGDAEVRALRPAEG